MIRMKLRSTEYRVHCTEYFLAVRGFSQMFSRNAGKYGFNIPLTFREFEGLVLV